MHLPCPMLLNVLIIQLVNIFPRIFAIRSLNFYPFVCIQGVFLCSRHLSVNLHLFWPARCRYVCLFRSCEPTTNQSLLGITGELLFSMGRPASLCGRIFVTMERDCLQSTSGTCEQPVGDTGYQTRVCRGADAGRPLEPPTPYHYNFWDLGRSECPEALKHIVHIILNAVWRDNTPTFLGQWPVTRNRLHFNAGNL